MIQEPQVGGYHMCSTDHRLVTTTLGNSSRNCLMANLSPSTSKKDSWHNSSVNLKMAILWNSVEKPFRPMSSDYNYFRYSLWCVHLNCFFVVPVPSSQYPRNSTRMQFPGESNSSWLCHHIICSTVSIDWGWADEMFQSIFNPQSIFDHLLSKNRRYKLV